MILGVAVSLSGLGCRRARPVAASTGPAAISPEETATPNHGVGPQQLEAFGKQLEDQINDGQLKEVAGLIDFDPLLEAAFAGIDWRENEETRGFHNELVRSLRVDPAQILKSLAGARAKFLRVRDTPRGQAVVIRCILHNGGSTYLEVFARPAPDGKLAIREIHNHATGVAVEEALRSIVITIVPSLDVSFLDRMFGGRQKIDAAAFSQLADAFKRKDVVQAKAAFAKMPAELKRARPVFMSYLQVLMDNPQDPAYLAALEEGQRIYGADPTLDFLRIDLHLLQNDYSAYDACLRRIEGMLETDAHLLTLRGIGYVEGRDYVAADAVLNQAVAIEPDFENAYRLRFKLAVLRRSYAEAITTLDELDRHFGEQWSPEKSDASAAFQEFLQSPEYRAWLDRDP
ncbi:MAG: tetratricopeptide repeat protein [Verrucomicrobiales bacterium]